MRIMKMGWMLVLMCTAMMSPSFTFATDTQACIDDARNDFQVCTTVCKDTFLMDKDGCRDVDHVCAEACRDVRETCVVPVLSNLQTCKEISCNPPLKAAIDACKIAYPKDSLDRHLCIDNVQVVAFQCRDTCRESVAGDLKACRTAFKKCIKGCPPAPTD